MHYFSGSLNPFFASIPPQVRKIHFGDFSPTDLGWEQMTWWSTAWWCQCRSARLLPRRFSDASWVYGSANRFWFTSKPVNRFRFTSRSVLVYFVTVYGSGLQLSGYVLFG